MQKAAGCRGAGKQRTNHRRGGNLYQLALSYRLSNEYPEFQISITAITANAGASSGGVGAACGIVETESAKICM